MRNVNIFCMEKDGAVEIPKRYEQMTSDEVSAECSRLEGEANNRKKIAKNNKVSTKTKFVI